MTCPECGASVDVVDGVVGFHTTLDTLTVCPSVGDKKAADVEAPVEVPKKPRKPRTKKP